MTELTERYVGATLRSIPEKQRADIEAELRASIADAVEAKVADGEDSSSAEEAVLTELGDPDRLAAGYAGRPGYLIGPELFFDYKRMVSILLVAVVPVVMVVVGSLAAIGGEGVGSVIGDAIETGTTAALHIAFWTTFVFALLERSVERPTGAWTLANLLPSSVAKSVKPSETIANIVVLVIAIAGFTLARTISPASADDGSVIPFFDPSMWDFWFPYFIVILAVEIVFELVKYRVGTWTWSLASVNVALNAAFVTPAIYLLVTDQIFNPTFFEEFGWETPTAGGTSVIITIVVISAMAVWDIIEGFRKARKAR